jgi:haloalkane dehalogenase
MGDSDSTIQRAGGLAYRSAGQRTDRVALLVHGYPESSFMWRGVMAGLADAGWWAIAPDLPGFGDSDPDPPGTWERHVDALGRFVQALELGQVALVVHDWGAMIGLRWACDTPGSVSALGISNGGFFPDRKWHEVATVMRTPGEGEKLVRSFTRQGLGDALKAVSSGLADEALDEYWKAFADDARRMGHLELYRSGDFEKLVAYDGCLRGLGVPALIVWGAQDRFADVSLAHRFHDELPGSELLILDDAGHFVWEDAPGEAIPALVEFLDR